MPWTPIITCFEWLFRHFGPHQQSADDPRSNPQEEMDSLEENKDLGLLRVWLGISQALGILCIILVSVWCANHLGGFAWQSNPHVEFNYHPFFMVVGLIFCYGEALLVYRAFRHQQKRFLKLLHFGLHTAAFIFSIVGLKAVFDSHNLLPTPLANLYSLHSWIGLTAVILFAMQYVCGFVAFLNPGLTKLWRAKYLPLHVFFGLTIFVMAVASALNGITEKLLFTLSSNYSKLPASAVVGNLLAYSLVIFCVLVVYIVVTPHFKRQILPEEIQLQLEKQSPSN